MSRDFDSKNCLRDTSFSSLTIDMQFREIFILFLVSNEPFYYCNATICSKKAQFRSNLSSIDFKRFAVLNVIGDEFLWPIRTSCLCKQILIGKDISF